MHLKHMKGGVKSVQAGKFKGGVKAVQAGHFNGGVTPGKPARIAAPNRVFLWAYKGINFSAT